MEAIGFFEISGEEAPDEIRNPFLGWHQANFIEQVAAAPPADITAAEGCEIPLGDLTGMQNQVRLSPGTAELGRDSSIFLRTLNPVGNLWGLVVPHDIATPGIQNVDGFNLVPEQQGDDGMSGFVVGGGEVVAA